jgi:hypothetical protein
MFVIAVANASDRPQSSPTFDKILVVVLENQEFWISNLNKDFTELAKKGLLLTNYIATTHPSQPNYISMIAGDTMDVKLDSDYDIDGTNLVDLFEEKRVTWKSYQEDYPGNCFSGSKNDKYRRKHNPFISFNNIRDNPERCAKIVNSDQLWVDLDNNDLPAFMFYTPNMDNDGHDTGIGHAAEWTSKFVGKLLEYSAISETTLIVVTFDEGIYLGQNKVYTLLIGPGVAPGTKDDNKYTHYSLLRTVEDNFGVGTLGRKDVDAKPFKFENKPPSFVVSIGFVVGISIAAAVVLAGIAIGAAFLIRRRCMRTRMMKMLKEEEPNGAEKYAVDA